MIAQQQVIRVFPLSAAFARHTLFLPYSVDFDEPTPTLAEFSSFQLAFFNFCEVRRRHKCAYSVDQFVFQFWAAIDRPWFDIVVNLQSFLILPDAGCLEDDWVPYDDADFQLFALISRFIHSLLWGQCFGVSVQRDEVRMLASC